MVWVRQQPQGPPASPRGGHPGVITPTEAGGTRDTSGRAQEKAVPRGAGGGHGQTDSQTDGQTQPDGGRADRRGGGGAAQGVRGGLGLAHPSGPRERGGQHGGPPWAEGPWAAAMAGQAGQLLACVRPPQTGSDSAPAPQNSGRAPPRQTHANCPPPSRQHPGAGSPEPHGTHMHPPSCWGARGGCGAQPCGGQCQAAGTGWGGGDS